MCWGLSKIKFQKNWEKEIQKLRMPTAYAFPICPTPSRPHHTNPTNTPYKANTFDTLTLFNTHQRQHHTKPKPNTRKIKHYLIQPPIKYIRYLAISIVNKHKSYLYYMLFQYHAGINKIPLFRYTFRQQATQSHGNLMNEAITPPIAYMRALACFLLYIPYLIKIAF